MKNPNSAGGAGAFRVTSNATVVRATDDTRGAAHASPTKARYYWDRRSHSVQRWALQLGTLAHE